MQIKEQKQDLKKRSLNDFVLNNFVQYLFLYLLIKRKHNKMNKIMINISWGFEVCSMMAAYANERFKHWVIYQTKEIKRNQISSVEDFLNNFFVLLLINYICSVIQHLENPIFKQKRKQKRNPQILPKT